MKQIVFIRHFQDLPGFDSPLDMEKLGNLEDVKKILLAMNPIKCFVSPYLRTRQTAELLGLTNIEIEPLIGNKCKESGIPDPSTKDIIINETNESFDERMSRFAQKLNELPQVPYQTDTYFVVSHLFPIKYFIGKRIKKMEYVIIKMYTDEETEKLKAQQETAQKMFERITPKAREFISDLANSKVKKRDRPSKVKENVNTTEQIQPFNKLSVPRLLGKMAIGLIVGIFIGKCFMFVKNISK